jgi:hypothetical protein
LLKACHLHEASEFSQIDYCVLIALCPAFSTESITSDCDCVFIFILYLTLLEAEMVVFPDMAQKLTYLPEEDPQRHREEASWVQGRGYAKKEGWNLLSAVCVKSLVAKLRIS